MLSVDTVWRGHCQQALAFSFVCVLILMQCVESALFEAFFEVGF